MFEHGAQHPVRLEMFEHGADCGVCSNRKPCKSFKGRYRDRQTNKYNYSRVAFVRFCLLVFFPGLCDSIVSFAHNGVPDYCSTIFWVLPIAVCQFN